MKKPASIIVAALLAAQAFCVIAFAQADQRLQDRFDSRLRDGMRDSQVEKGLLVVK
jgi:hypothetical protein